MDERFAPVKSFMQHGFHPVGESGDQIYGMCPFCLNDTKMYINKATMNWDCKACGVHGGFQTFLAQIHEKCVPEFTGAVAFTLAKKRGLTVDTLKKMRIGFNKINNAYVLPMINEEGKMEDLRIYKDGKFMSTSTCKTGLWNHLSIGNNQTIYLCEGEWDGMAMDEVIRIGAFPSSVAVAVPGANVLKAHWVTAFKGKDVIALYDHDNAGKEGTVKCYNALKPIVKTLRFIHWPDETPDGYDARDLWIATKNAKKTIQFIEEHLRDTPTGDVQQLHGDMTSQVMVFDGAGLEYKVVHERYQNWLHLPDTSILDVLFGAIIANRLQGDPVWLFLVAPPGMTKSELLQSFSSAKGIDAISTLTAHTLVSGATMAGGYDPSLIPQLDQKVLVIKDFTTVLNMNQQSREEVFGDLRDAFDGEYRKPFGNGIRRSYSSKFGILAGVTPVIDLVLEGEVALGERFLRCQVDLPVGVEGHIEYLRKAAKNVAHEEVMRKELKQAAEECLNYQFDTDVAISEEHQEQIIGMAVMVAMMRGTVPRDKYTKEIVAAPYMEIGTRLTKQLSKLLLGICMFRRKGFTGEEEMAIIRRIARNTIPQRVSSLVQCVLAHFPTGTFGTKELGELSKLPQITIQRHVESCRMLGIVDKVEDGIPGHIDYKLADSFLSMNKVARLF
jgi:hypothetical protein